MKHAYIVLLEDRHIDPQVEVWTTEAAALARGRCLAEERCNYQEDWDECDVEGWLLSITYSSEGDAVTVFRVEVQR